MAFTSHRTKFKGDLAGVSQEELRELDYNLTTLEERMNYINNKYETVGAYYNEYVDEYYKVDINTKENLSEDINIFQNIERDADYILNSVDLPRDRQQKYKFYTRGEFEKVLAKEKRNVAMNNHESKETIETMKILEILEPNTGNYYMDCDVTLKQSDFKNEKTGAILSDYNRMVDVLKAEMRKVKNKEDSKYDLGFLKRNLSELKSDMMLTKKILNCIMRPSTKTVPCKHEPDYDWLDYSNHEHIKALISNVPFGEIRPDSMLSHIAYDMEVTVEILHDLNEINDIDVEIIKHLNSGETIRAIGEIICRDKKAVQQRIDKVCRKIANFYKD